MEFPKTKKMNQSQRTLLLTLLAFACHYGVDKAWFGPLRSWFHQQLQLVGISHSLAYTLVGIPIFLGVLALHGRADFFRHLGLDGSLFQGFYFSLICCLPMFIGFALVFDYNHGFSWNQLWINVLAAAFFEELYFRGFLFGQIFRYSKWGFLSSVSIGALLFGMAHFYQGNDLLESLGIFGITFLGGILFAWVFVEWNYNLWVPIFLHLLMNLVWSLFAVAENALGGVYANVFRLITILAVIALTLLYKRKKGLAPEIGKANWR